MYRVLLLNSVAVCTAERTVHRLFQGGLTYEHARYGIIKSLDTMVKKGLIDVEEER